MKLSTSQLQRFWREWPKSATAMGWTKANGMSAAAIDAKRKEFLAGCGFSSLTEVDRTDGFTRVLHELIVLQGTSVGSAQETIDPTLNQARVLRNQILTEIIPCLEMYRPETLVADLAGIMEDKNRWWKLDRPAREMTIMDLDARPIYRTDRKTGAQKYMGSQLSQLQWTLSRWLNDLRNQAGDTVHGMKMKADVSCDCALCRGTRHEATAADPELESTTGIDPDLGAACPEEAASPF